MKINNQKTTHLIALLLLSFAGMAQSRALSGTVTSEDDGETLPGVTISIKGTSTGVISGIDGEFTINVENSDTIVVSYVGFVRQEIAVGARTNLEIALASNVTDLDEVIVVGYGTVRKSDLTGAVSSVGAEELSAFPVVSATQALQGRAAGLNIQSNNGGAPGAALNIRIRGTSSINVSSSPLVVVDGFPGGELPPAEDIESIEVLKDASATAIYGSRAMNGIIMVTTKRGKSGKTQVSFNSSYSFQETLKRFDLLNAAQFTEYQREFEPSFEPLGFETDWQDEIYRVGYISNNQLSVRGGNESVQYYVSGTYFDQNGVMIGSDLNRYSANANIDIQANDRLKIGVNLFGRRTDSNGIETQGNVARTSVTASATRFRPDAPIYNEDGSLYRSQLGGGNFDNPYALATEYNRNTVTDRYQTNNYLDLKLTDWLSFKSTLGINIDNRRIGEVTQPTLIEGESIRGLAEVSARKRSTVLSENYFTYNQSLGDAQQLTWVVGYSFQKTFSEIFETFNTGFTGDVSIFNLDDGADFSKPASSFSETVLKSYYSRINYALLDRYKFTFTGRYDGSSTFAPNKKWAFFPSAAFAWNLSEEAFLINSRWISNTKMRVSYGLVGNSGAGFRSSFGTLSSTYSTTEGLNAFVLRRLSNDELTWEVAKSLNLGLDMGFLEGRINFSAEVYDKRTEDLLFGRQLPGFAGIRSPSNAAGALGEQFGNVGALENRGIELTVNSKNIVGAFSWSSDIIFSLNRNKILRLADTTTVQYGNPPGNLSGLGEDTQLLQVGQPIGVFYGYVYDGIYQNSDVVSGAVLPGPNFEQEAGGEKFRDISGPDGVPDGRLDPYDRTIIGDPNPDFTWSLNNTFSFKNFDLNVFVQGSHGQEMLNFSLMELERLGGGINTTTTALNRWTVANPNTDIPRANSARSFRVSNKFIFDASYVRIKNVALGYNFPKSIIEKLGLTKLRIYGSAQNLFTFTKYPGLDPETGYRNNSNATARNTFIGLDYASYPNVKSYTLGINASF